MITVISKKNKIAAEIVCDINNLKNSELKKIKFALNNFGMIYFRNQNLIETQLALNLSKDEIKTLLINSFKSSVLSEERKKEWINKIYEV